MKSAAYNAFTVTLCVLYLSVIACPITHADRAKPAAFKDPARELWMTGYLKMQAADKAEKAGNPVLALERYEEAHNVFLEVCNKYPDWNASLLSYRAQYCKEKIGGLRETVAAQQETLSKESLVTLTRRQTAHIQELETTIGDLERRLELTATSLERARREAARNASARERVDELVADNSRLSTRAETMQGHIRELQQQVAKLKENAGLQEVAQELRNELDVTAARQQELESAAKTYRENMENLRANLKKVSVERVQLKRDNEVLKELFDRAKERIATFEDDTDTLEQQLATTRSEARKASTALAVETKKRENLQEQLATIAKELREARGFRDKYFATQGQTDKQEDARTVETVKALTKLLQEKEKHVQELKDLTQNLTADVQTQKQALEQKQQELVEQNRLVAQHKQGLRRLEKQNAALLDRLGQEESGRSRTKESSETLRNEYEKLEDRTAGLEKENLRLTEKNKAQLTLLRQQEKQLKNLRREQAQMKFTQGTSEQDSPVTALKEELQRTEQSLKEALTFKEYAQQKISDLEKQLASAKSKKPAGMDSHLPQDLKQVQRELEEKQAHIERLEKALAQQTATPDDQTPPPAITQNGKTPKPSERDKELVIAGLLEKAVAAEKSG
ncbi:MAG: hypothetical protein K9N51_12490, partial [Candidatus Pacebacteria bacterium]|nr:hypothetical protein [Candidatus Paceibacterota bacterium]